MARSIRWKPHAEQIARWVASKYEAAGHNIWDYIDDKPGCDLKDVGITKAAIIEEILPKIEKARRAGQSDVDFYEDIRMRIYNLFHRPGDRLVRQIAEWPISVPLPPRQEDLAVVAEIKSNLPEGEATLDSRREFPNYMVIEAMRRQNNRCLYCRQPFDHFLLPVGDHIIPWSLGGPTTQVNCAASCKPCNHRKGSSNPIDFTYRVLNEQHGGRQNLREEVA